MSNSNFFKNTPIGAKVFMGLVALAGLGFGGYKLFQYIKKEKKQQGFKNENEAALPDMVADDYTIDKTGKSPLKVVYPKKVYNENADLGVMVRKSPKVNDGVLNNQMFRVKYPKFIGELVSTVKDSGGNNKYKWHKVKLYEPYLPYPDERDNIIYYGYVREDVVDLKSVIKKIK